MCLTDVRRIAFASTDSVYGTDECCTVDDFLGWSCAEFKLNPHRQYTGERGCIGDTP